MLALNCTDARREEFTRQIRQNELCGIDLEIDCGLKCSRARKSAEGALLRKGLGRKSRSRRNSGGREAAVGVWWGMRANPAAVAAIPGGVRRIECPRGHR